MKGMAWIALAGLCAASSASPVMAQGRPDTRAMSCQEIRSLVEARGAIVLSTGQHTYDRYVSRRSSLCEWPYVAKRTTVNAADTPHCPVYYCREVDPIILFDRD